MTPQLKICPCCKVNVDIRVTFYPYRGDDSSLVCECCLVDAEMGVGRYASAIAAVDRSSPENLAAMLGYGGGQ